MSVLWKNLLMPEDLARARSSRWSAESSALVADALRRSHRLNSSLRLRVHGESMLPSLWPGDVVEIADCRLEDVRPGEILLALRDGRLFLHRLVALKANGFVLRGDSVPDSDPEYPREALLGRLVSGSSKWRALSAIGSRATGRLFCHWNLARRLALRLHSRKSSERQTSECKTLERQFRSVESGCN